VGLFAFEELDFEVGDALLGEVDVGAGTLEALLKGAVFLSELLDAPFECRVLGERDSDGVAGDHLLGVAELTHQFPDALSLGEHLLLRATEFGSTLSALSRHDASTRSWVCAAARSRRV
jgi:hypothetical protein